MTRSAFSNSLPSAANLTYRLAHTDAGTRRDSYISLLELQRAYLKARCAKYSPLCSQHVKRCAFSTKVFGQRTENPHWPHAFPPHTLSPLYREARRVESLACSEHELIALGRYLRPFIGGHMSISGRIAGVKMSSQVSVSTSDLPANCSRFISRHLHIQCHCLCLGVAVVRVIARVPPLAFYI